MKASKWHQASIGSAVVFAGFSAVHLIDDFLFNVPMEFHLTIVFTEVLALAYLIALVGLIAAASHQSPTGYPRPHNRWPPHHHHPDPEECPRDPPVWALALRSAVRAPRGWSRCLGRRQCNHIRLGTERYSADR